MKLFNIFILVLSMFYMVDSLNNNTLLLIISFDGFRFDYYTRNLSSTLVHLRENSSYAPYMISVFPTKTFPNHFSIATGLYTEIHGVLDNKVFDKSTNKTLEYSYELFHYNSDIVPLWTLNERGGGGRRSGCMMWPGSNFPYQNTMASHVQNYTSSIGWREKVDMLLSWYRDPERPINLGLLYFAEPDKSCHEHGPDSKEVDGQIKTLDGALRYLLDKAGPDLLERLNIVVLSDHGGQAVKSPEHNIRLEHFVNPSWYRRVGVPPNLQIYPIEGKEKEVLKELRDARSKKGGNFSTFTKEEMLDRWHYKNCERTPPILVTADVGFLFYEPSYGEQQLNYQGYNGTHGYDPQEESMWAFFLAHGPQFKRNFTVQPFENVNIYPMAMQLLGLNMPPVKPNGTLSTLQSILVNYPQEIRKVPNNMPDESYTTTYFVAGFIVSLLSLSVLVVYFLKQRRRRRENSSASYRALTRRFEDHRLIDMPEDPSSDEAGSPS